MAMDLEKYWESRAAQSSFWVAQSAETGDLVEALKPYMHWRHKEILDQQGVARWTAETAWGSWIVDLRRTARGYLARFERVDISFSRDPWTTSPPLREIIRRERGVFLCGIPFGQSIAPAIHFARTVLRGATHVCCYDPRGVFPQRLPGVQVWYWDSWSDEQIEQALMAGCETFYLGELTLEQTRWITRIARVGAKVVALLPAMKAVSLLEQLDLFWRDADPVAAALLRECWQLAICCVEVPAAQGGSLFAWDILPAHHALELWLEAGDYGKIVAWQKSAAAEGALCLEDSLAALLHQGLVNKSEIQERFSGEVALS